MSATAPGLAHLRQQLHDLQAALAAEDDTRAAELVRSHDRDLRQYLAAHGVGARAALGEVLELQVVAMAGMRQRRDDAALALRSGRRSHHAARAYLRAGAL